MSAQTLALLDGGRLQPPLVGVDDALWERFAAALAILDFGPNRGQARGFAERRGGYGCFGIQPRRLVDLGIASDVRMVNGKVVAAIFKPTKRAPTSEGAERMFLGSPSDQRKALGASLALYDKIVAGEKLPAIMSRSGALALFHRLGPHALKKWAEHKEDSTVRLFVRANRIF